MVVKKNITGNITRDFVRSLPFELTGDGVLSGSSQGSATGGTITDVGGYRIHMFTSSGDFVVSGGNLDVEYLVVAGGGGGGANSIGGAGGGGAGGRLTTLGNPETWDAGTYPVVVGAGGAGATGNGAGANGSGACSH